MADVLEIGVKQSRIFRVGERDFALVFTVGAVAALEDKLGRSMKNPADWFRLQTKEVQDVLEAGFKTYHADEAKDVAEAVCRTLDAEQIENVIDFVCWAACPKAMERLRVEVEKMREAVKKGLPLPNVPSGAVS
jgi:hypothetical protein